MKSVSPVQFVIAIVLVLSGLLYLYVNSLNVKKKSDLTEVNGIVEEVYYNEKGYPSVLIEGAIYYIPIANSKDRFQIGDSIVKKLNDNQAFQYRNGKIIDIYEGVVK